MSRLCLVMRPYLVVPNDVILNEKEVGEEMYLIVRGRSPYHGLYSKKMALITSDCDAMRIHEPQMALITSECVPFRSCTAHASRPQLWSGFAACCGGTGARSQPHRLSW